MTIPQGDFAGRNLTEEEQNPAPEGLSSTAFWTELLTILEEPLGGLQSDPSYYADLRAQPGEWGNVISKIFERTTEGSDGRRRVVELLDEAGFWAPGDDLNYWIDTPFAQLGADVQNLARAGEERLPGLFGSDGKAVVVDGETQAGGGVIVAPIGEDDPRIPSPPDFGVGLTELKILEGQEMEWFIDPQTGTWYVSYGLPGSDRALVLESTPEQMDQIFGANIRPVNFSAKTFAEVTGGAGTTFGGNISEMAGEGRLEDEYERVLALALDEGKLPDWAASTPEIMDIIYLAQLEDKNTQWVLDQISTTQSFRLRFPKLDAYENLNMTLGEAIDSFLDFEATIKSEIIARGGDPTTLTPSMVGQLAEMGHNKQSVSDTYNNFRRMEQHKPALDAFNAIRAEQGLDPLTPEEQLEFMAGTAPAELYDQWEAASFQEQAQAAGLGDVFDPGDALRTALATPGVTTDSGISEGMRKAASLMLQFRGELGTGQLDLDDLIDASLGIPLRSGNSPAELAEEMARFESEAKGFLEANVRPFFGFTPQGVPQARSLGRTRQQQ